MIKTVVAAGVVAGVGLGIASLPVGTDTPDEAVAEVSSDAEVVFAAAPLVQSTDTSAITAHRGHGRKSDRG